MKKLFFIPVLVCSILACRNNKKDLIVGTWHSVKIENRDVDSFFVRSKIYIDTVGRSNDAATNMELYGVENMDSMRRMLQLQYDSVRAIQAEADTQTVLELSADSMATLRFPDRAETGKWYYKDERTLVLKDTNENGEAETTEIGVELLDETTLKLRFVKSDEGVADTSHVTFRRENK